jgi:hypothetical protein
VAVALLRSRFRAERSSGLSTTLPSGSGSVGSAGIPSWSATKKNANVAS